MQANKNLIRVGAAALFVAGVTSGLVAPQLFSAAHAAAGDVQVASLAAPVNPATSGPIPLTTAPDYRAIVARNSAAVVGITTVGTADPNQGDGPDGPAAMGPGAPGAGDNPFGNDPFFRFFRQLPVPQGRVPVRGLGSGFIVGSDGLILTNAHVVRDAKQVTVELQDKREFKAKVLGFDTATDIAVLKIDAHDLPTVREGDSNSLQVGDYVLAIGAPYGFSESATAGIVSAKGRSLPNNSYVPFIQTDVAVNPGNSGGPLFDSSGAVVGINSQIYSNTGGYEGVSFAIPIDVALHIKDQIVAHGKVEHGRLGIHVQPLTQALAQSFKLDNVNGALVAQVEPDSAAAKAGIKPGDVILKYDGQPVSDAGSLSAAVGLQQPGQKADLQLWRDGKAVDLSATLGSADDAQVADAAPNGAAQGRLGLAVRPLTPQEQNQSGLNSGLLVQDAAGAAADAGIQPGDVVLAVDGTPVKSVNQLRDIVNGHDKQLALLIQRGDARIFVPVNLG